MQIWKNHHLLQIFYFRAYRNGLFFANKISQIQIVCENPPKADVLQDFLACLTMNLTPNSLMKPCHSLPLGFHGRMHIAAQGHLHIGVS